MKTVVVEASKVFGFDKRPKEGKLEPAKVYCGECKYFIEAPDCGECKYFIEAPAGFRCKNANCEPLIDTPIGRDFNWDNCNKHNKDNHCSYFEQVSHDPVVVHKMTWKDRWWAFSFWESLMGSLVVFGAFVLSAFITILICQAVIK